jgi:hypothetical protein
MSATAITKVLGSTSYLGGLFTKDASGQPCVGLTYKLNVVSGDPTGLNFATDPPRIGCAKLGVYTVTVTATNSSGTITSDAAGDTDGTVDTITVVEPPPASQGWTYT